MTGKYIDFTELESDHMLIDTANMANHKRSPIPTPPSSLKKNRGATNEASNSYKEKPWHYKFWYGFPIMEE
jgi:hypothetical protein